MSISRQWSRIGVFLCAAAASSLSSCGRGNSQGSGATAKDTPVDSASTSAVSPPLAGKAPCPATGLWAECSAFDALDRAGLAPRRDSSTGPVRLDPLSRAGTRFLIGNAQIDVFIYPSEAERARDEARLDKHDFIEATGEPTLRGEPTLIRNANLLAVLRSRNDHQRERVSDALSAGPPQPSHAAQLPGSKAR